MILIILSRCRHRRVASVSFYSSLLAVVIIIVIIILRLRRCRRRHASVSFAGNFTNSLFLIWLSCRRRRAGTIC